MAQGVRDGRVLDERIRDMETNPGAVWVRALRHAAGNPVVTGHRLRQRR